MRISDFSIENPVKVAVGVILLCMFGLVALLGVPVQLTPDVSKPTINVQTQWAGAAPQEIEKEIIEKQEEVLKGVKGMMKFQSECRVGRGEITMEFAAGTSMSDRLLDVGNALQQVRDYPPDSEKPRITSVNANDSPIAWFSLVPDPPKRDEIEALLKLHPENQALHDAVMMAVVGDEADLPTLYRLSHETDGQGQLRFPELTPLVKYRVDPTLLKNFAENVVEASLERVDGVANANIYGGLEERLEVIIDPADLARRNLTIPQLRDKLAAANKNVSAGDVRDQKSRHEVRVLGEFNSIAEVENVIINEADQTRLRDLATVQIGYAKPDGLQRQRGMPSIGLNVQKEDGANVMVVMEAVKAKMQELNEGALKARGLRLVLTHDQTTYIDQAVDLVQDNIYVGSVLTILVLLFYLRNIRSTAVIAVSIPITLIGTFLIIRLLGRSLNVISLAGLAFAVGIVVDNAIVVLENIFSHYQRGEKPRDAVRKGTSEVWGAVLASTLSTLAVFIPVIFVQEQAGQLFRDLAIAIIASVGLSLIVSLTVVPSAAARLLKDRTQFGVRNAESGVLINGEPADGNGKPHIHDSIRNPQSEIRNSMPRGGATLTTRAVVWLTHHWQAGRISNVTIIACCLLFFFGAACLVPFDYRPLPRWLSWFGGDAYLWPIPRWFGLSIALGASALFIPLAFWSRRLAVALTMMLVAIGLSWRLMPGTEYLPEGNRNLIYARVQTPPGYNLAEMAEIAAHIEERLRPYWEPVPGYWMAVGKERQWVPDAARGELAQPRIASLFLGVRDGYLFAGARAEDPMRAQELLDVLRYATTGIPDAINVVQKSSLFEQRSSGGRRIDVEITGDDMDKLLEIGARLKDDIERIYPAETTKTSVRPVPALSQSSPELHVRRNRVTSAERRVSNVDLGYTVNALVDGAYAGDYWHKGEKINLVITAPLESADQIQELRELPIATMGGETVPLGAVADIRQRTGPDRVVRVDRQRAVTLEVKPGEAVVLEDAMRRIEQEVVEPVRHSGLLEGGRFHIRLGGTADELNQMRSALGGTMVLAILITYLLMAGLYESFTYPLVVMVSVPMGYVGGFLGLWLLNQFVLQKLDTLTMLGFVILTGNVVNNAILVIDQALIHIRQYGMPHREAVTEAVRGRVRPIMMTTVTTLTGLLPLVIAPGAGSELYRGLGAVVLGGLCVSTVFVLILVPMLFTLTYETKQRLSSRFRREAVPAVATHEPTPVIREPALVPGGNGAPLPGELVEKATH